MANLRTDLDRIGRRVEPTGDALERLEARRHRKERNRRLAAGSLALLIAIGGSIAAYTALRDDDPGITGIADGSPPPAVPAIARVRCDGSTTVVESTVIELDPETGEVLAMWSSSVRPQADGVHILVTNTSDIDLSLQFRDLGGDNAPVGRHEVVWPIAPGPVELRCLDPYSQDAGAPGGYVGLEVVDPEPLPKDHPLWSMTNVTITPHIGGMTDQVDRRRFECLKENVRRFVRGEELNNIVDKKRGF